MNRVCPSSEQRVGSVEGNGFALYPLAEATRFEEAKALGETRTWKDLSDLEQIGFEIAEILHQPT